MLLQHIKAIINSDSIVLIDSDNPAIIDFIPELQVSEKWVGILI